VVVVVVVVLSLMPAHEVMELMEAATPFSLCLGPERAPSQQQLLFILRRCSRTQEQEVDSITKSRRHTPPLLLWRH